MQPVVFRDVAMDIVMFPVWWYSRGLVLMLQWCSQAVKGYAKYFALGIWMKNIFVPMFGQYDWQSRLISVFMRSVQIIGRSIGLLVVTAGIILLFGLYIAAPIFFGLQAAYHVIGSLLYVS